MGLGVLLFWISLVPNVLSPVPPSVLGAIFLIWILNWTFACISAGINHFKEIYKSKGRKAVKSELMLWTQYLYFLGCFILIFYGGTTSRSPIFSYVGLLGFASGFLYGFIPNKRQK